MTLSLGDSGVLGVICTTPRDVSQRALAKLTTVFPRQETDKKQTQNVGEGRGREGKGVELTLTRMAGTTVRTGEGGAGGALRGLVKAEGLSLTMPAWSPRREAAAFSFRMAMLRKQGKYHYVSHFLNDSTICV